ncbi:M48 family metallopeptidase [Streptomyces sp. NPDC050504]|uniref:M48 family metallopeptidase n=1 Tax=Streptomyces sp. NPDC050504 TaxID=3365618 RepID=UPI00379586C9
MGSTLRALRALVLLAGFHLLGLLLLVVLGAIDWAATLWTPSTVYLKLYVVSAVLAVPVVRGMFMLRTPKEDGEPGFRVPESHEPRLWAAVRDVAAQLGTRAPDEIVLTGAVDASVCEEPRLLGLRGGRRSLCIGLPLMTGLTEAQLRAVIAHEMGHYANADTRLAVLTARGRVQVLRTVAHFEERAGKKVAKERARQERRAARALAKGRRAKEVDTACAGVTYRAMARLYTAYARYYLRATLAASRRQELAADAAAARVAGRDATASALREVPVLDSAHAYYMNAYATLGVGAGLLPPPGEVFGGVRHLLAARAAELAELRGDLPTEPASPYDSHPAIAERVARVEALPDDGLGARPTRPSLHLLDAPDETHTALEHAVLTPDALRLRRVDWPQLVHESMTVYATEAAEPLRRATTEVTGVEATLPSVLEAIDRGALWQIADRLPTSEGTGGATAGAAREFARPRVRQGLSRMVAAEYAARGWAHWQLSWSEPAKLHLPEGYEKCLESALDAAVSDPPDTAPLRKLLPAY